MRYTIKSIQNTGKPVKYLFFWDIKSLKIDQSLKVVLVSGG